MSDTGGGHNRSFVGFKILSGVAAAILPSGHTNMTRTIEKWVEVNASQQRVFGLLGEFQNYPHWMTNVREARRLDNRRALLWTTGGAAPESPGDWEAQVTAFDPPRRIAWRAAGRGANAQVEAEFEETQRGTTLMRALLTEYSAGATGAGLFGSDPAAEFEASLERFKRLAEGADEDATLIAQTPGRTMAEPVEAAAESRPLNPARPIPPPAPPPPPAVARPVPVREERVFLPAKTEDARRASTGRSVPAPPHPALHRRRSQAPLIYAGLAALLALALGAWLWGATRQQEEQSAETGAAVPSSSPAPSPTTDVNPAEIQPTPSDTSGAPNTTDAPDTTGASNASPTPTTSPETAVRDAGERPSNQPAERPPAGSEQAALKTALADWVAVTNSQNVAEQMAFYAPVMERYYLRSNFSRRAVREDKTRLAERASLVNVTVGEPEITYDREGRQAVMRFRKKYSIEGSRLSRGEVVQELKWAKTSDGWKIISERDVRVVR